MEPAPSETACEETMAVADLSPCLASAHPRNSPKMARTDAFEIEKRVCSVAAILKIDHLLDRRPRQLSDLDAELRVSMRIEIARLHRELGNTMIYVTHDQTEAMTLADKIPVGVTEYLGSTRYLYCQTEDGQSLVSEYRDGPEIERGDTLHLRCRLGLRSTGRKLSTIPSPCPHPAIRIPANGRVLA